MYETGAKWIFYNTTDFVEVWFNDPTSPWKMEEVTGFDSPNIRGQAEDYPEWDGAVAGDFFYGARPLTFRGRILPASASARNVAVAALQQRLRGLRAAAPIQIKSQAQGLPEMTILGRIQNLRVTGGFIKDVNFGVLCPDPRILSAAQHNASSGTTASCPNAGNYMADANVFITGPCTNPVIWQTTPFGTVPIFYLDAFTLTGGQSVQVNTGAKRVMQSGSSVYSKVRFPPIWPQLYPGANTISVTADTSSAGFGVQVFWQDTWM
jgi:hypothetical protein